MIMNHLDYGAANYQHIYVTIYLFISVSKLTPTSFTVLIKTSKWQRHCLLQLTISRRIKLKTAFNIPRVGRHVLNSLEMTFSIAINVTDPVV